MSSASAGPPVFCSSLSLLGVLINSVYNLQASALFVVGRHWVVMRAFATHVFLLAAFSAILVPRLGVAGYGWA